MTLREIHRTFGRNPDLAAVIVWSIQQALKSYRRHPDHKRQTNRRLRDLQFYEVRRQKAGRR